VSWVEGVPVDVRARSVDGSVEGSLVWPNAFFILILWRTGFLRPLAEGRCEVDRSSNPVTDRRTLHLEPTLGKGSATLEGMSTSLHSFTQIVFTCHASHH
jgi:hypothetical protein